MDGLYPSWENDNRVARKFCDLLGDDVYDKRFYLRGRLHPYGRRGTALVTGRLLSAGRNPDLTKAEIEQALCDYLGVSKGDLAAARHLQRQTNEHVDNVCAFTAPGEIVLAWTDTRTTRSMRCRRRALPCSRPKLDAKAAASKVHRLPLPKPVTITAEECEGLDLCEGEPIAHAPGERLAAKLRQLLHREPRVS